MPAPEEGYLMSFIKRTREMKHYGTPGMKWGRRKARGSSSSSSSTHHAPAHQTLSDDDLKKHISRLLLEKQYKDLTAPPAKKPSLGKKFLADVLTDSGKKLAVKYLVDAGIKAGPAIVKAVAKAR